MRWTAIIGGRVTVCHACGRHMAAKRYWRQGVGTVTNKACSRKCHSTLTWRGRDGERVPPQARTCPTCKFMFLVPHQSLLQERVRGVSQRKQKYCSMRCYLATIPASKYADDREYEREKKRRYRANLRARLGTST